MKTQNTVTVSASDIAVSIEAIAKEQAALICAALVASDKAKTKAEKAAGTLTASIKQTMAQPAQAVGRTFSELFLQLRAVAMANCKVAVLENVSPEKDAAVADEWRRLSNSAAVVMRRVNNGKAGEAPAFGLFYIGLNKADMSANVQIIKAPTEKEVRAALHSDQKALNAALEQFKPVEKAKKAPAAGGADSGKHVGIADKNAPAGGAAAAIIEQVQTWRAGELEALAAQLLNMAAELRKAAEKPAADKKPAAAKPGAKSRGETQKRAKNEPGKVSGAKPVPTAPSAEPVPVEGKTEPVKVTAKGRKEAAPTFKPTVADKVA